MLMQPEFVAKISEFIIGKKKSLIVTHRQPDGDALGASLAWMAFLRAEGCEAVFLSPTDITRNLDWLPFYSEAISFEQERNKARALKMIETAEVVYCLDFNALSRLDELGEHIATSRSKKVMIDHHRDPENFTEVAFSDIQYAATSEMIFDIISALEKKSCITPEIATLLYTGICTDTGFFQFNNTTPHIFTVASELVEKGAKPDMVSEMINNIFHERRLKFFGYCLDKKLRLTFGGKVAYMMVSAKEIKRFRLQNGDSEGLVNYPFKIKGVEMCAYFSEEHDKVKISFRSKGNSLDMNEFARKYFDGGGHFNASGGKSFLSLEETEIKFLKAVETFFSAKP